MSHNPRSRVSSDALLGLTSSPGSTVSGSVRPSLESRAGLGTDGLRDLIPHDAVVVKAPRTPPRTYHSQQQVTVSPTSPVLGGLDRRGSYDSFPSRRNSFDSWGMPPSPALSSTAGDDFRVGVPPPMHLGPSHTETAATRGTRVPASLQRPAEMDLDEQLEIAFAFLPRAYKPYYDDPRGAVTYVIGDGKSPGSTTKTVVINEQKELEIFEGVPEGVTPNATIHMGTSDFLNCVNSTLDPVVAYMIGKAKVDNVNQVRIFGNNFEFDEDEFDQFTKDVRDGQMSGLEHLQRTGDDTDGVGVTDASGTDTSSHPAHKFSVLRESSMHQLSNVFANLPTLFKIDDEDGDTDTPWDEPRFSLPSQWPDDIDFDTAFPQMKDALTESLDALQSDVILAAAQDLDRAQDNVKEALGSLSETVKTMKQELVDKAAGDAKQAEALIRSKFNAAVEVIREEIVTKAQDDAAEIELLLRDGVDRARDDIVSGITETQQDAERIKKELTELADVFTAKVTDSASEAVATTKTSSRNLLSYVDSTAAKLWERILSESNIDGDTGGDDGVTNSQPWSREHQHRGFHDDHGPGASKGQGLSAMQQATGQLAEHPRKTSRRDLPRHLPRKMSIDDPVGAVRAWKLKADEHAGQFKDAIAGYFEQLQRLHSASSLDDIQSIVKQPRGGRGQSTPSGPGSPPPT